MYLQITRFTADASHELRTPIAHSHRSGAGLAAVAKRIGIQRRAVAYAARSPRTAWLIEELLTLARADSGMGALDVHRIDLLPTLLPPNFIEYWR